MEIAGWGKFPIIDSEVFTPRSPAELAGLFGRSPPFRGIARGMGRSYGDSALAPRTIGTLSLNHILDFQPEQGTVRCQAGATIADLLEVFVPRGWFPPVVPGTKFVTVGGAIASDIHGKNHHLEGSFCDHVSSIELMLPDGRPVTCSGKTRPDLFRATCGGMGLTGVILEAAFKLKPIRSAFIRRTTLKAANLAEAMELFETHAGAPYSVAWIDCLSTGRRLGRSLLMLGEHDTDGRLEMSRRKGFSVPIDMPGFLLNRFSMGAFNGLYYHRVRRPRAEATIHYEPFFFPLDAVADWNRLYGKNGFTQYQLALPREAGQEGIAAVLGRIAASKQGSFLAVLKAFGKGNRNFLSFPTEGYTLAVDFKLDGSLLKMLDELDRVVLDHGGRLYLTKDTRMSESTFKRSYPGWEGFQKVRRRYKADTAFHSLQSDRLGL